MALQKRIYCNLRLPAIHLFKNPEIKIDYVVQSLLTYSTKFI
jgi:hypothetical protein